MYVYIYIYHTHIYIYILINRDIVNIYIYIYNDIYIYIYIYIYICINSIHNIYIYKHYNICSIIGRTCLVALMLLIRMRSVCIQLNTDVIRGLVKRAQPL